MLATRLADAGFTPSIKHLDAILELFADEDVARDAERAVLRIEAQYARDVTRRSVAAARGAVRPARARLTQLTARLARERDPEGVARAWLVEALADTDPKTRRAAARGLGQLPADEAIRDALERAYDAAETHDREVLALALAKAGGGREKLTGRAGVIADREARRAAGGGIVPDASFDRPTPIRFHVRSGLEAVLMEELGGAFGTPRLIFPGVVEATIEGPFARALAIRTALHVGFPLAPLRGRVVEVVPRALASEDARAVLRTLSTGPVVRFRLAFPEGHRRADVWAIAEHVRRTTPDLVNDPKGSPWEVAITDRGGSIAIELVPRGAPDPRFAYRVEQVPASSHPTIAAALARLLPTRADDVVWDPFVGAGVELVERARLGPFARLIGSDRDARAITAARSNLDRAGVAATLEIADATTFRPFGVTAIVTNPPMGRRVERGAHADLLARFVAHAAALLPRRGVLVWMDPSPKHTHPRATSAGLRLDRQVAVDMGGFSAELSRWQKPYPYALCNGPRCPTMDSTRWRRARNVERS